MTISFSQLLLVLLIALLLFGDLPTIKKKLVNIFDNNRKKGS